MEHILNAAFIIFLILFFSCCYLYYLSILYHRDEEKLFISYAQVFISLILVVVAPHFYLSIIFAIVFFIWILIYFKN